MISRFNLLVSLALHMSLITLLTVEDSRIKRATTSMMEIDILSITNEKEMNEKLVFTINETDKKIKKEPKPERFIGNIYNTKTFVLDKNNNSISTYTVEEKSNQFQIANEANINKNKLIYKARYRLGSKNNPIPPYPLLARKKGWQGTVLLLVSVNEDGTVKNVRIEKSTGFEILDKASLQTIKKWFFIPAKKGKKNIKDKIIIPVRFTLN